MVAVAAISFTSCSNNFTEEIVTGEKIQFNVSAVNEEVTRSAFGVPSEGTYPTLWSGDEGFVLNINGYDGKTTKEVEATFIGDKRAVNLSANIVFDTAPETYTLYAIAPATAYVSVQPSGWQVTIPTSQTTGTLSCDPAAQILVGASEKKASASEIFDMTFKHAVAYGKMSLKNLALDGAKISSVAITSTVNIAGRFYINQATREYSDNSGAKTITVNTTSTENIWFALAPVDVSSTELEIVVNTDKGTFTKPVNMPANRKFELGKISTFNVDMNGIELAGPDETEGETVTIDFGSTAQRTSLSDDAQVWKNGGLTFTNSKGSSTTNVASYSNPVRLYKNSDITISSGTLGEITKIEFESVSNGTNDNQKYQTFLESALSSYNPTVVGQVITVELSVPTTEFTATMTAGQVRLHSLTVTYIPADPNAPSIGLEKTSLDVDAAETTKKLGVTLKNINESDVNISWYASWLKAVLANGKLTLDIEENVETASREASITLSANGVTAAVTVKQKGKAVDAQLITVAEFIKKDVSEDVEYILSGTITAVANTIYGNFDLTDDTGTVYIYGLVSPDGATNKYWATSKAKLGDDITIKTTRADFNGTPQGKNAKFVELVSPGTRAFYTVDPMVVDFASAGGEEVVSVTTYNTDAVVTAVSDNDKFTVSVNGYEVTISAAANEREEKVEGNVTINVGDLGSTKVKVTLAAKPAAGTVEGGSDDFHTISTNTSYVSGKTTAGWDYKNCAILKGGTSDSSPAFKMIGDDTNRALCMNGKTSAVGTITSPTLTTGCGTLKFNYGLPFSDTKIKFRVDIMQNGAVVKTFTINNASASKVTKYSHKEENINVAGDFQIVFTNLSPSNSGSNKDRTAIWDVEWTGYKN